MPFFGVNVIGSNHNKELCTCLSCGWVYVVATNKETSRPDCSCGSSIFRAFKKEDCLEGVTLNFLKTSVID